MKRKNKRKKNSSEAKEEIKRLNRIEGQLEGIKKMLSQGRDLEDVLIQCKAVHAGLKAVESKLLKRYLDTAIRNLASAPKKKHRERQIDELMDLYKPVA